MGLHTQEENRSVLLIRPLTATRLNLAEPQMQREGQDTADRLGGSDCSASQSHIPAVQNPTYKPRQHLMWQSFLQQCRVIRTVLTAGSVELCAEPNVLAQFSPSQ